MAGVLDDGLHLPGPGLPERALSARMVMGRFMIEGVILVMAGLGATRG